ncbi:MAG: hypothetical protein AAF662_01830 [Pseudomonadota bacterium]
MSLIKIYGERNTGTNYLEQLISANFGPVLYPGNQPIHRRALYRTVHLCFPDALAFRTVERLRDRWEFANFETSLGWKHAQVPCVPEGSRYPKNIGFVTMTKNPFAWLVSLYRRPYQNARLGTRPGQESRRDTVSFLEFLESPWETVGREFGPQAYETPIDMWNRKTRAYLALQKLGPHLHLRYEDLLSDTLKTLASIERMFNLARSADELADIDKDVKGSSKSKEDYRLAYTQHHWRRRYSSEERSFAEERLDPELMNQLEYTFEPCTEHT